MLALCDLPAGRGDSLGPKILLQRWLGLATPGGAKSPVGQIKRVMLVTRAVTERMQNTVELGSRYPKVISV